MATNGEKEKLLNKLDELSQNMPVFLGANMSYGVHALTKILAAAVPLLDDFDIELTEAHHNKKGRYSPVGTLEKLYDVIVSLKENVTPVYDRHELNEKRQPQDIGIHSIRGGTIVGEHEVLFAGTDETIQITHSAPIKRYFCEWCYTSSRTLSRINQTAFIRLTTYKHIKGDRLFFWYNI